VCNACLALGRKVLGNVAYCTETRSPLSTGYRAQSKGIPWKPFPGISLLCRKYFG